MNVRPSILGPLDFSDASAGALRYAAASAAHFTTRLIVLTVEDPLLTEGTDLGMRIVWSPEESIRKLGLECSPMQHGRTEKERTRQRRGRRKGR
jgi:Universal stress protein family